VELGIALSAVILGALVLGAMRLPLAAASAGASVVSGVAATVQIVALLLAALVASLRAAWSRIAVRVVGSWIAAVGMLLIGWILSAAA
jgi:hypothetical protein